MSLILDLEDTVFNSSPNGDLELGMTQWKPIVDNIFLIQEQSVLANNIIVLSYAIDGDKDEAEAKQVITPQLKRFFPKASEDITYLSIQKLCALWNEFFCLRLTVDEFCIYYTKEMVAQTIFLRQPALLRGSVSYFFDDCVTDHKLLNDSKVLKIISVPKPHHVKAN